MAIMMAEKRYFWLKLKSDFFTQKEIKKLRRIAGGDTYTIIYLKMQLRSLESNGKLYYEGFEDTFASELALDLDEDQENVQVTLIYLEKHNLIEKSIIDNIDEYLLPIVSTNLGTETATAIRVRKHREKHKSLQCNKTVTPLKQNDNGELELEIEEEIEEEIELELKQEIEKPLAEKTIDYLNKVANKRFSYTKGNLKEINAQIKKGHTEKDLAYVIDVKCNEWLKNNEMKKHLNPVTLFRDSNFDRYLNQEVSYTKDEENEMFIKALCKEQV
jgi:predicted phage replisome organizer/uncharacterized phage protein (TIGR02220 family)